jgi:hypothetical protein
MQKSSEVVTLYDPLDSDLVQGLRADDRAPDVAKVSMLYGDNRYYLRALETHIKHAKRHGYPAYILRKELIKGVWNKLLWLSHAMVSELSKGEQGAKWIMYVTNSHSDQWLADKLSGGLMQIPLW